jgi:hypothetical protein
MFFDQSKKERYLMNRSIKVISLMIPVFLLVSACSVSIDTDNEGSAEQTLQAIYLQQTVEALTEPVESASTPEPQVVSTAEPTATREIVHTLLPGEPGWVSQWWLDTNSTNTAGQNRANGGDFLSQNLLERPFTAQEMQYRPDVDLIRVELGHNPTFYYIQLHLSGVNPDTGMLSAFYGVEFDTNRDGRGDVLLWVKGDGNTEWNINDIRVFQDGNDDIGAARPVRGDAPTTGVNGYDQVLFSPDDLNDPDAAWKRVSPSEPDIIQLAIKKSMLGNASTFMWVGWADDGAKDPAKFDYNDVFTLAEAGSHISGQTDYPLKGLFLVDNTCRLAFGFEPSGKEVGGCVLPTPTPTPVPPTATPKPTPTQTELPIIS